MKPTLKVLSRKERLALQKKGTEVSLDSTDPKYEPQFEPQRQKAREILSPSPSSVEEADPREGLLGDQQVLPTDGSQQVLAAVPHTVVSKASLHTVRSDLLNTPPLLPTDGGQQVLPTDGIPLSPLQWHIWERLIEADQADVLVTYQELAKKVGSTKGGVRDAVYVIQKEGGIREKTIFRQANPQGMRVRINANVAFYPVSTKQAQGVLKRGMQQALPTYRVQEGSADHPPRMYVCKNTYIQEQDIADLLNTCPAHWQIREATLLAIADLYLTMDITVFRLSLLQAVRQEQEGKTPVRHHNAWLKAAFVKNGGPLVTRRDIEARLAGDTARKAVERPIVEGEGDDADMATLRRYMAASDAERAEIDQLAAKTAAPTLEMVSEDKRAGVLEEAKLEAAREYFSHRS